MAPSYRYMQGCLVAFILFSILGLMCEGAFLGDSESTLIHDITKWNTQGGRGFIIPMTIASAIAHIPQLVSGDFAFFDTLGVAGALLRLIIYAPIAYGLIWGFMLVLLPIIANFVANSINGIIGKGR
jgi:hypothetical protein